MAPPLLPRGHADPDSAAGEPGGLHVRGDFEGPRPPRAGEALLGVPARGLLRVVEGEAEGLVQVGSDQELPELHRYLFFREHHLPIRAGVLRCSHHPFAIRVLQTADAVWVHVRDGDVLDQPDQPAGGHGLLPVEQRADAALLLVQLVQGGAARQPQEGVEEGRRRAARRARRPRLGLPHGLLRLPERKDRGPLQEVQAGLHLAF